MTEGTKMMRGIIVFLLALGSLSASSAQGLLREGWKGHVYGGQRTEVVYDSQSVSTLQVEPHKDWRGEGSDMFYFVENGTAFLMNKETLRTLALLEETFYNMALVRQIDHVTVTAATSPNGTTADNERLASARAMAIKDYLMEMFPYLNRDRIVTFSAGEDWSGLRDLIVEDNYMPGREQALRLLAAPLTGDILRERLKEIAGGEAFRYISRNMFPKLQGGATCFIYYKSKEEPAPVQVVRSAQVPVPAPATVTAPVVEPASVAEPVQEVVYAPASADRVGEGALDLKTNAIYLATATMNLGLEVKLAKNWSFELAANYNGWDFTKIRKWKHALVQPEVRFWFRDAMKTGHFVGVHGHWAMYNLGNVPTTRHMLENRFQGDLYGAGLSYGYRWNLRNPRWALEATVGGGYTWLKYDHYDCVRCGDERIKEQGVAKGFIGPTKLGFSVVYRIGGKTN